MPNGARSSAASLSQWPEVVGGGAMERGAERMGRARGGDLMETGEGEIQRENRAEESTEEQ